MTSSNIKDAVTSNWQPTPRQTEQLVECELAHMDEAATARALGVELADLLAWRAWLAHWSPEVVRDAPGAVQPAPQPAETAFKEVSEVTGAV
jgi:hypothetical protein